MAATIGEKRAYTRGYGRGQARMLQYAQRALEIARAYRQRLTDVGPAHQCQHCRRWSRGGDGKVRVMWGQCGGSYGGDLEFDRSGAEPGMWADTRVGEEARPVITHDTFGCVNWLPKESERV